MSITQSIGRALRPIRPGLRALASARTAGPRSIEVSSAAFAEGGAMDVRFTADGPGLSPPLTWSDLPAGTESVVLLVQDADPPMLRPLTHLIVYGLRPDVTFLMEGEIPRRLFGYSGRGYRCGRNAGFVTGWLPPSPPPGHGPHRYAFQLYALDSTPRFPSPPGRAVLLRTILPNVLAQGRLIGTYERLR